MSFEGPGGEGLPLPGPAEDESLSQMLLAWPFWCGGEGPGRIHMPTGWPRGRQTQSGALRIQNQAGGVGGRGASLQMFLSES